MCLSAQYIAGFASFLFPGVSPSLRRSLLPYHSYIGLLLTVLPTITICLGLLEKTTFMATAATKSQADEVTYGRWLANSAGMLALVAMAAVVYVLVGGGAAVRREQVNGGREAEEAEKERDGAQQADVDHGEQAEGQRSVFSVPVPYPSETSSLLQSADEGKREEQPVGEVEEAAPPASFSTFVDEMLNKHFSRRESREGHAPATEVRVDEYGSTAQYRRGEQDRHARPATVATSAAGSRRSSGTVGERGGEGSSRVQVQVEQMSPESPESMWPRFKGVGASGVILKSP